MSLTLLNSLLTTLPSHPVLDPSISPTSYIPLNLSIDNPELVNVDVSSSKEIQTYISDLLNKNVAKVAVGGYLEKRAIYNRSDYFTKSDVLEQRNIHLGLDLWIEAGSSVFAPLDGQLHSFKNNTNYGDYGPTLILHHKIGNLEFYTLYGHLSLDSISNKAVGQEIEKGQKIATLGTSKVNGDYAPHLHFQIIIDLQGYEGDYPGVSNQKDLKFYRSNCPDPNVLLKLI